VFCDWLAFAKEKVFNDLGRAMLDNAWNGYNCSVFAYGQTGSGKSYSVMGNEVNRGIFFTDISQVLTANTTCNPFTKQRFWDLAQCMFLQLSCILFNLPDETSRGELALELNRLEEHIKWITVISSANFVWSSSVKQQSLFRMLMTFHWKNGVLIHFKLYFLGWPLVDQMSRILKSI